MLILTWSLCSLQNWDDTGARLGENDADFDRVHSRILWSKTTRSLWNHSTENNITGLFANGITTSQPSFSSWGHGNGSVFVNGEIERSIVHSQSHGPETSNNLQIGAIGTGWYRFNGENCWVIVSNQLLSTSNDRQQIESYLASP
jgi:hypothetical protein